jgi:putative membrane protein
MGDLMRVIEEGRRKIRISKFNDWLLNMIGYAIVLISVSLVFKNTIYIDNSYFGIWGLVAAILIYFLNKTIKPIIVLLTLPLTGLTLGLFYPFINVFILNIVDFILGKHFTIQGIFMTLIVSIFISVLNYLMDRIVYDAFFEKGVK